VTGLERRVDDLEEACREGVGDGNIVPRLLEVMPLVDIAALYKRLVSGGCDQGCIDIICRTPAAVEILRVKALNRRLTP
jgi:hypothetical protein